MRNLQEDAQMLRAQESELFNNNVFAHFLPVQANNPELPPCPIKDLELSRARLKLQNETGPIS